MRPCSAGDARRSRRSSPPCWRCSVVVSVFATFSWGFPFWPALIIGGVAFHVARKQRRGPFRPGSEWERRLRATADDVAANRWSNAATAGPSWGDPGTTGGHHGWGDGGHQGGGCGGHGRRPADTSAETADSPFDTPAFWEAPTGGAPTAAQPRVDLSKDAPGPGSRSESSADRTTPPAWDPLGAAPFAWDLPEIDLTPASPAPTRRAASPVIARGIGGLAVLVVAASVLGIVAGWWNPAWAMISGAALAIVAVGLFVQAVRGRSLTLIGPGVFLSIATLIFSVTGFTGTPRFGEINQAPTTAAELQAEYELSAGDAHLDLSGLQLTGGERVATSLDLGAGDASVILPAGVGYRVTCSSKAGQIDCLGRHAEGLEQRVGPVTSTGDSASIDLDVHVGAGNLTVTVAR